MKKVLVNSAYLLPVALAFPIAGHATVYAPEVDPAYASGTLVVLGGVAMKLRDRLKGR